MENLNTSNLNDGKSLSLREKENRANAQFVREVNKIVSNWREADDRGMYSPEMKETSINLLSQELCKWYEFGTSDETAWTNTVDEEDVFVIGSTLPEMFKQVSEDGSPLFGRENPWDEFHKFLDDHFVNVWFSESCATCDSCSKEFETNHDDEFVITDEEELCRNCAGGYIDQALVDAHAPKVTMDQVGAANNPRDLSKVLKNWHRVQMSVSSLAKALEDHDWKTEEDPSEKTLRVLNRNDVPHFFTYKNISPFSETPVLFWKGEMPEEHLGEARIVDGDIEMNQEIDGVLWTVETFSSCYMDMGVRVSRDGETVWSNPHYLSTDGFDPDEDEITFEEYLKGLVEHFFDEIIETVEEEMKMKEEA